MFVYRPNRLRFSKEMINEAFKKARLSMIPYKNGSCKKAGCSGLVKKKIYAFISGVPIYDNCYCDTCGTLYLETPLVETV